MVIIGGPIWTKNAKVSTVNGSGLDGKNCNNKGGENDDWTADEDIVLTNENTENNDLFYATSFSNNSKKI